MQSLIFQATIYLAAMVVAVPLARRLGLGSVLGYLGAGIVIGPVFGLVGHEAHELRHFAEFGVVIMLFLIGLELEPRALAAMWRRMLGLGATEIALATVAIAVVWTLAGRPLTEGLAVGMILSLSSTAIVLQTLSERDLLAAPGGRSAFAVLLTQDIAVIPMLILIPLLGGAVTAADPSGEGSMSLVEDLPGWGTALVTLGAIAAVVLVGSYVVHHAFRYAEGARLREVNTALSLLLVFATALLMQAVGLSPALGTFLAGVLLANSEFRHELQSDLEPFRGLLLELFFLTVGAGMDFSVLAKAPILVPAILALTLAAKGGILWALGHAARLGRRDRLLFALSLAGAGEFGFVLLAFAEQQGVIATTMAQPILMAIALSMLMTPFLFMVAERIAPAPRSRAASASDSDVAPEGPIIICGIGRFGQVTNRLLQSAGLRTTVLDHDLATVRLMRRFGFKAYLGDPTRPDLLRAAGIETASILVAALDDPNQNTRLVRYARRVRPDLFVIARARDRVHVFELYRAGADKIVREVFDSAVRAGRYALEASGFSDYEAARQAETFWRLDRQAVRRLAEVWKPGVPVDQNPDYVALAKALNRELELALMEVRDGGAPVTGDRPAPPDADAPADGRDGGDGVEPAPPLVRGD